MIYSFSLDVGRRFFLFGYLDVIFCKFFVMFVFNYLVPNKVAKEP